MGHRAARIEAEHLFKTPDGFFMIEAVTPVETDIEPSLCLWRPCGYSSAVGAEIEPFHGPPICDWSLLSGHLELLQLDGST
jgi:hypothetical protein